MAAVSLPVGPAELRSQVDHYGPVAYLVTVAPETGRPHVVSVSVGWEGDALVCGAGSRTAANVGAGADVTLLWSPTAGDGYSLIVDGPARVVDGVGGPVVSVRPVGAVLHRLAGMTGDGPNCIAVTTMIPAATAPAADEEDVVPEEHPNATVVRRFLNAWFDGDFDTWTALAADDIVIHMRGKPALDGSYRGQAGVLEFFEKFAAIEVESLEMEVDDVVADDRYAMIIMHTTYRRADERLELRNACAYRLDSDGRIAEAWNVSDSQVAEADFFHLAAADVDAGGLGVGLGPP
jgi:ketosteroid isomerase-like protein